VHQLHCFHCKFTSVTAIRVKIIDEFEDQVPDSLKFSIGYFDGKHQMYLFNIEDLNFMYSKYKLGGELILWCDGRCREDTRACRK